MNLRNFIDNQKALVSTLLKLFNLGLLLRI